VAGWDYSYDLRKAFDVPEEGRIALWETLWEKGGFNPWLGNFIDLMSNREVSDLMYAFWRDKVRQRTARPELIDDLCPDEAPEGSPFGTKRPSLETSFYEVVQQPNVELVNLKKNPILEVTPNSIIIADGNNKTKEHPVDIIILATGFDAGPGSLTKIDIRGSNGMTLNKKWAKGTRTQLGLATAGFPNLFFLYGPQNPGAFAIGPVAAEIQGDWLISCLGDLKKAGKTRVEALTTAEERWAKETNDLINMTLIASFSSWYIGANVPRKIKEATNYISGLLSYTKAIYDCTNNNYDGFVSS
jgi:cation diffusion facilitator CzcD-associated flavoprotein CzcO